MNYLGTKIQSTNSLRRPFKSVFEQVNSVRSTSRVIDNHITNESWFSRHEHLFQEEEWYGALAKRIHVATALAFMIGLIVALV